MKVVLINKTASGGGAAMACKRLHVAFQKTGKADSSMLVQQSVANTNKIFGTTHSKLKEWINFVRFAWERICFLPFERSKEIRFAFSLANTGENISNHQLIREASVIHLHWFNQGFLSLKDIKALKKLNKPIVWTLHDMWAFTGGCHYSGDCKRYETECNTCPYLKNPSNSDLSSRIFKKKAKLYKDANITLVGCSQWMADEARKSKLLRDFKIVNIPNPIDTALYRPQNKPEARIKFQIPVSRKIILFGAAKTTDKRKGLEYLVHAIHILSQKNKDYLLVTFGKSVGMPDFSLENRAIQFINDERQIAALYNAADVFVVPSLEDNLPNTIMESLSCGTPVVAFKTGGIPEMVTHKETGYLASLKNAEDLAAGIEWVLEHPDYASLQNNARKKVENSFSEEIIAVKYQELYAEILIKK